MGGGDGSPPWLGPRWKRPFNAFSPKHRRRAAGRGAADMDRYGHPQRNSRIGRPCRSCLRRPIFPSVGCRSEEHTSELQSLMRISYAVFCLKKNKTSYTTTHKITSHTHHTTNII